MNDFTSEFHALLNSIDATTYQRLKNAIEIGRWPSGERLTAPQQGMSLQAIIVYESKNLPPAERTGYIPPKLSACGEDQGGANIRWVGETKSQK
jgi:uncharacterized protein